MHCHLFTGHLSPYLAHSLSLPPHRTLLQNAQRGARARAPWGWGWGEQHALGDEAKGGKGSTGAHRDHRPCPKSTYMCSTSQASHTPVAAMCAVAISSTVWERQDAQCRHGSVAASLIYWSGCSRSQRLQAANTLVSRCHHSVCARAGACAHAALRIDKSNM